MEPTKVTFYVYADSDVRPLEKALHDFVVNQYKKGVLVTADKLTTLLERYSGSSIMSQFLR